MIANQEQRCAQFCHIAQEEAENAEKKDEQRPHVAIEHPDMVYSREGTE